MALNIKDPEADRLAGEIAAITGESKTRAVRVALAERRARLEGPTVEARRAGLLRFLEDEIWPQIPRSERKVKLTKAEREELLGLGPDGV
jgi:antitoxin VapB